LKLRQKLERRDFLRIVEVFPPNFIAERDREPLIGLRQKTRDFLERVKKIQNLADAILVADVKDLTRLKLGTIYSAALVQNEVGIEAVPVITARDSNRPAIRSAVLTALSLGLDSLMFVWGDTYENSGAKNVYDYTGVGEMIREAGALFERSGVRPTFFAPLDLATLDAPRGRRLAQSRLKSGAEYLLAQPPTADVNHTFPFHMRTLRSRRLNSRVLLNVFPFRSRDDIEYCRKRFGWDLPPHLDTIAERGGEPELLREAKRVADRLREVGSQGVYVSTRGRPELARFILD
jgi:5,10-methylenetetrahydrofolate reductase